MVKNGERRKKQKSSEAAGERSGLSFVELEVGRSALHEFLRRLLARARDWFMMNLGFVQKLPATPVELGARILSHENPELRSKKNFWSLVNWRSAQRLRSPRKPSSRINSLTGSARQSKIQKKETLLLLSTFASIKKHFSCLKWWSFLQKTTFLVSIFF